MPGFVKHIGKHGDRKVAIVYRMVPGEDHMCLVVYPDTLPKVFHDSIMKVLESEPGQQAENLSDALFRNLLPDGRPMLETLHREGMIKKVATNQIIVTPNATSHVHLDELNKMLGDIEKGDDAAERLQKLDENAGLVDPLKNRQNVNNAPLDYDPTDLSDEGLAKQRIAQSNKMAAEAQALLEESKRLQEEAWNLDPALKPKQEVPPPKKKKATRKKAVKKTAQVNKKADVKESTTVTKEG